VNRNLHPVLRIGFVGAGLIGWAHALGLRAMIEAGEIDASVSAVYDIDSKRASRFAVANHTRSTASLADVVEACDAVWVCTPTSSHSPAVERAVLAGRAVFCEKPLATDLAGAEALAQVVARSEAPAQVGLVLRSTPVFRALRDVVASGELGRPMAAVFRDDQYFPVQGIYRSDWRSDVTTAGGGCLMEHSIHDLDMLRFCLGEVTEVAARTACFSGHKGVEDVASVSLRFESGASAELVSIWHNILTRGSTRRVELFGEAGMAWLDDDFRGPLHVQTSAITETRPCRSPDWVDALPLADDDIGLAVRLYTEADRAFVEAVAAANPPTPSFDDAVAAHRLVDAAYRSAASGGTPVSIG
jgi:predicted dehydrogenase